MGKWLAAALLAAAALVALPVLVVIVATGGAGVSDPATPDPSVPGSGGIGPGAALPPGWLTLYQQAATTCPGLSWSVLAAVGTVESGSGQSNAPGVWSGANPAGAEGPMQFEPSTFAAHATVGPSGARPASPYDPVDAVYTAAALLCADGAGSPATLRAAVLDYNHDDGYADTVLTLALGFEADPAASGTVVAALSFAARQLNAPYLWGGTGPGGFDCSGLSQAAYGAAGIALPRVAQQQFDAGPAVPPGSAVEPGDLIFFGDGPATVDHVGLYVGGGEMIEAPRTQGDRRLELPFSFVIAA